MKFFLILAFHIAAAVAYGGDPQRVLPTSIKIQKCPRKDASTRKCLIKMANTMRPNLKLGIPELNIPRIEPFKMKYIELNTDQTGLVLKGEASNIVANGAGAFVLKDIKLDMKKYVLEAHVYIPKLVTTADYMTHGSKLYLISINGSGQFKGTFSNVNALVRCSGHPVMKDGKEFAKIDEVEAKISFGKSLLESTPDNPSFAEQQAADYLKSNSQSVMDILEDRINEVAAGFIKKYMGKIMSTIPVSDLLLD